MVHAAEPGNAVESLTMNGAERHPVDATASVDPRKLTTLPEIISCLSSFQSGEVELSNSLTHLLSVREPILASLSRLQSLVPRVEELYLEASQLSNKVSSTAETAERIGGRVRALDEEMRRVREAGERVSQVMELKSSLNALQSSTADRDWESATRHCSRAMSLPPDVISGPFAESAVPTSESHLPPSQTLQLAREQLLSIFRAQFDQASRSRDAAATSRFFKLFPAIGWEKEGLEAYAAFVVDLVRVRAPVSAKASSPLFYITALTSLFESIAMIVDHHHPVVEKYYGPGKMTLVIAKLMEECDRVTKSITEGWEEERSVKRKLLEISAPPVASIAGNRRPNPQKTGTDEDQIDPREVDKLLSEVASMTGRWAFFRKFLSDCLLSDQPESDTAEVPRTSVESSPEFDCVQSSASHRRFDDILMTYYVPLEVWYIRSVIEKALRLSNPDLSQLPTTTTTPDDVFYVLKIVLSRLISTGSIHTIEKTLEHFRDVVDRDYASVIRKKLDDVYRTAGSSSVGRGEKVERENRFAFIVLLNDLDVSASHTDRLIKDVVASPSIEQNFLPHEHQPVKDALSSFLALVPRFRSILRAGVEQLFNQLMRPKLRTLVTDIYKDVSYVLDDDSYAQAEYQDVVRKRFIKSWESLVDGYKETFTETNYRLFFGLALDVLLRPWEKVVVSFKFTELGAIRFDHELRSIMAYLSSQTAFGDAREKFIRLQQISTLLNLDSDEDVDEFFNGSGISWKLSGPEARVIANLRV